MSTLTICRQGALYRLYSVYGDKVVPSTPAEPTILRFIIQSLCGCFIASLLIVFGTILTIVGLDFILSLTLYGFDYLTTATHTFMFPGIGSGAHVFVLVIEGTVLVIDIMILGIVLNHYSKLWFANHTVKFV